jgi:hypothetical protein
MKVTVIYVEGNLSDKTQFLGLDLTDEDFKLVHGHPSIPNDDEPTLELVWRMMNRVNGDTQLERFLNKYSCRSMVKGDFVVIGDMTYRCQSFGWKRMDEGAP